MFHLCNVLNVVGIGLDRYRTGEESVCNPVDNCL